MAYQCLNVCTLLVLVSLLLVLNSPHVRGRSLETLTRDGSSPVEGTAKSIKGNNGEMVDCVDIYKQPALGHPLLKDHIIQMDPSASPSKTNGSNSAGQDFIQPWNRNGMCSEGTVPIQRRQLQDTHRSFRGPHHEYAGVVALPSTEPRLYGGGGQLSVWNPAVSRLEDHSASALTVVLSEGSTYIAAGWIVHPELYGDFQTRFFVYWTSDDSVNTGCFDLHCEGFVQVNNRVALGAPMESVSTIGAKSFLSLRILIFLDKETGNWWLSFRGEQIGYWPAALFSGIPEGAARVSWGGQIFDSIGNGQHTETDMGNGLFPDVGTNKASVVCALEYVDSSLTRHTPSRSTLRLDVTNPLCYDVQLLPSLDPKSGLCFLFGGSGRNPTCP
ncbi:uncharacterized protein [Spinacia oleracea]|uniref:Neprosin PEP catalytic domain-containing protein n=1 Tax=Spinacia oleracea TaxID=3562 RepID=A0A9R0I319_SPIOL|nr:uncharacterized protein LOC110781839 [Spinacia oleracea]